MVNFRHALANPLLNSEGNKTARYHKFEIAVSYHKSSDSSGNDVLVRYMSLFVDFRASKKPRR